MDDRVPIPGCPRCGSSRQATIVYGLVEITDDFRARLEEGAVALGGSAVGRDNPGWLCRHCGARWGRSTQARSLYRQAVARERARRADQAVRRGWLGRLLSGRVVKRRTSSDGDPLWDRTLDA